MRWIIRIVVALVVVIVAAVAILFLLPAERIAKLVTDQFEATTGRAMTLQGDVRPSLWPDLGVKTGAVTIANADWSDGVPMIQAEGLSVGVDLFSLFSGNIRVKKVEATAPQILLEVARDGRANWDMLPTGGAAASEGGAAVAGSEAGGATAFSLDMATISDGRLTYVDHGSGSRTVLSTIDAIVRLPDFQGAAELEGTAAMNGQAITIDATIHGFADFLSNGAVPVNAAIKIGGSALDFNGNAGLVPLAAGGKATADLADMKSLFALVGSGAPALPYGFGQKVFVGGDMTLTDAGRVTLRNSTIRLDKNVFSGAVDANFAGRPKIIASLSADALDFSAAFGETPTNTGGGEASAPIDTGWSKAAIDVSGMQAVDAEIALAANSIDLGIARLNRTQAFTVLDKGRAVTELKELVAYGGTMAGSVVVNSRGGLSTRANLTGDSVALQPLLEELMGYDRLVASGDVAVNVLGVGNSVHALMNSLSGSGSFQLGQGELRGLDLVGMLRTLDTSFIGEGAKTIFSSIGGSFVIKDGVLQNDDLGLLAPLLNATGKGTLGIGAQTINYRVVPKLLEGQTNGGIKVPLIITGTWAKPKFRLDLEALAEQELADEIKAAKDKVETVVKEKLESELGVKVDDLGDVEDALKKELEERAVDGVLKLLGGN